MLGIISLLILAGLALCAGAAAAQAADEVADYTHAVVVAPPALTGPELKAVGLLVDEVERRTRIRWTVAHSWPADRVPVVAVGRAEELASVLPAPARGLLDGAAAHASEGYRLRLSAKGAAPVAIVAGSDARGVLFGVGGLLRTLVMERDRVTAPAEVDRTTAPRCRLRGHQLGYRPKTNSYDGWTVAMWEQYIRDLAVFGANAVELIPPRSDDAADSPHFPLPPMQMMVEMSRLLDEYGLDVWVWYPAMDRDYTDPATVAGALKEWGDVLRRLPRLDAVFVPGGDPGHTPPRVLMAFLAKQAAEIRRWHPKAEMWVSPQGFDQGWFDEFIGILRGERPAWLTGVVFGPQVRVSVSTLRALVPDRYPIRHYPDITHTRECQYPVPDWDVAYGITEARECINPRPLGEAAIVHATRLPTIGFITYSEGCNDDVNKAVWSALGWDPDADVADVLREYARYFIGPRDADGFAQGLLALERNWQGPLMANGGVTATLQRFEALERAATPQERLNWRFQQALYRAYYDAYVRSRLRYETELEGRALKKLARAPQDGSLAAAAETEAVLSEAASHPVAQDLRARVFELGEALFQSIRMQLSVERYQAISVDRGANLDTIDVPLNNRQWIVERLAEMRRLPDEDGRLKAIDAIVRWTDPGPGGFYDDLGDPARRPHLVTQPDPTRDPGCYETTRTGMSDLTGRVGWARHLESLYDSPITLRYTGLDPHAAYRVRVVYGGDDPSRKIRLTAGAVEVHPLLPKPVPGQRLEFDVPPAALSGGDLALTWHGEPGRGGNGRSCQVCELWLVRR